MNVPSLAVGVMHLFKCDRCEKTVVHSYLLSIMGSTLNPGVPQGWVVSGGKLVCEDHEINPHKESVYGTSGS